MKNKRHLTVHEERALTLVHHDFKGYSRAKTAQIMGVSKNALDKTLQRVCKKAPQFFPILTPLQNKVYQLLMQSEARLVIAVSTGWSISRIDTIIGQLHKKGFCVKGHTETLSYDPQMDNQVVRKF